MKLKRSFILLPLLLVAVTPLQACYRSQSPQQQSSTPLAPPPSVVESAAVNRDSLAFVSAPWTIDTLSNGLILHRIHFANGELFNANQYICYVEMPVDAPCQLAFTHRSQRTRTSTQARQADALVAINGSFFDMSKHHPICYLRIDGKQLGENTAGVDSINRKYYQYGSMTLNEGRPHFFIPDSNRHAEDQVEGANLMTAGPMLIFEGKQLPMRDDRTFVTDRHNRTAIAEKADGTVILFVVDGRMKESAGMSLTELATTLQWLGCRNALNLDGGGSTTLYLKGWPNNGVVNHPSDNGRYDSAGERGVSNCVIIQPRK